MSLTQAVKNEALRLGFSLVGVTTAEPPPHWQAFQKWLTMGRHGSLDYMSDPRRADPHLVLPECKSILMLAARYPKRATGVGTNKSRPVGQIAAYAWGRDYHLVLTERLRKLTSFIETACGHAIPQRGYTDTGPILERDLAQRAGLGWIGKNTCFINQKSGSYFLLAEILLGIELEADAPFTDDRCGKCTRCITACPTGCILPDRTLDARLCISMLTIENKHEIPPDLRPQLGNLIFGCDICQQVCPWNRFADQQHDPAFNPRPGIPDPDLISEMELSPGEFNQKYRDSAVMRCKRGGYLRNVAVALGNAESQEAKPALERAVQNNEPLISEHAAWALEKIRSSTPSQG